MLKRILVVIIATFLTVNIVNAEVGNRSYAYSGDKVQALNIFGAIVWADSAGTAITETEILLSKADEVKWSSKVIDLAGGYYKSFAMDIKANLIAADTLRIKLKGSSTYNGIFGYLQTYTCGVGIPADYILKYPLPDANTNTITISVSDILDAVNWLKVEVLADTTIDSLVINFGAVH